MSRKLARTLRENRKLAELFRTLATLVQDVPVGRVDSWKWQGVKPEFAGLLKEFGALHLLDRLEKLQPLRSNSKSAIGVAQKFVIVNPMARTTFPARNDRHAYNNPYNPIVR